MLGLAADGGLPFDPQPGQVLKHRGLELGPATQGVDVLDAQQEPAALGAGGFVRGQGREGVAPVQQPRRRGREAGDEAARRQALRP